MEFKSCVHTNKIQQTNVTGHAQIQVPRHDENKQVSVHVEDSTNVLNTKRTPLQSIVYIF